MNLLLSTKLRPTQGRPKLVARPHLVERLDPKAGRRLTLLSAPAGFGKTTLLHKWWRSRVDGERFVAWLSVDEGDNDPTRFVSYVVAAISKAVGERFGEGIVAALRSPGSPRMDGVLGALVNDISDLQGNLDLVLDDYHVADSAEVHRIVTFLLENLPEGAHLVIASRVDPPLPLARLRARNQIDEIRAPELAFAPKEAATFLKGVMGLELSAEDMSALQERTEGWIAGLQLAALSMRDRKDLSGFVESFSGSHRDILDFLAEEVLERQAEPVRSFLIETSILDTLTAPLCDALTGRNDGDEMLEMLERENLFVVALDDERRWYRYHHLFADFLRSRLIREHPDRVSELHNSASSWSERNGSVSSAIEHAFSAEDYRRAARLIERGIDQTWYRGEVATLLGWLERLPQEELRRRPLLLVWYAAARMISGQFDGVESLFEEAERAIHSEDDDPQHVLAIAAASRSQYSRLRGNPRDAVEYARRALDLMPRDGLAPRPFATISLALAYQAAGDRGAAIETFAEAGTLGQAAGHDYVALNAMASQSYLELARGNLNDADEVLRRALGYADGRGSGLPAVGSVHIGMGELLYEWDDLEESERELERGAKLAARGGELETLVRGRVALSRARQARGDVEGALATAREAERMARSSGAPEAVVGAALWTARLHLTRDELEASGSELERASKVGDASISTRESERACRVRLLMARKDYEEALRVLDPPDDAAPTCGGKRNEIEMLALKALAAWAGSHRERAVITLVQALALAEPEGYIRTFVDEGPPMAVLLSETLEARRQRRLDAASKVSARYINKLLSALERDAARTGEPGSELPEPLSKREMEILRLLSAGKSNRLIGAELYIGLGTVKTHLSNLYRKLGAHSRTQAVARARELSLI